MSSGARRIGENAVVALVPVAMALASCGGGSSGKAATSTSTSSRASSTTAGPSAPSQSTSTTRLGSAPTGTGGTGTTSSTTPGPGSTSTTAAPTTVRVDASENHRTVSLRVGDTLQIVLTGCGGCGYTWRMTGQPSPVVFTYMGEQTSTAGTTSTSAGQPPVVGQPVDYVWTFKAVGAHTTGFIAQYFPPAQGAAASQTFAVQLRVAA